MGVYCTSVTYYSKRFSGTISSLRAWNAILRSSTGSFHTPKQGELHCAHFNQCATSSYCLMFNDEFPPRRTVRRELIKNIFNSLNSDANDQVVHSIHSRIIDFLCEFHHHPNTDAALGIIGILKLCPVFFHRIEAPAVIPES